MANPLENKRMLERQRIAKETIKFSYVADLLIKAKEPAWTNSKNEPQWRSTLETYAYPILDSKPLDEITRADVINVLEPYWNNKTETMSRVRQLIQAVLGYAMTKGWYGQNNSAEWQYNLDTVLSRKRFIGHHESLPYNRLPWFYSSLQQFDTISSYALQFTILTASRTSEVRLARPEEIDFTGAIWNVPAERMKARASHRVPLSKPALELVERVTRKHNQPFIFPSTKPETGLSNGAMHQLIHKRYPNEKFTVHGFRTTFRIWAAEVGDYDQNLAEIALAHSQDKKVEGAYMRSKLIDKRREMMEDFAQFATSAMQQHCMIAH
ncbi:site-specific integrase [Alphaproteobacteria bacterium]|nr:site-specific integrase [Alphaproteobacteria bacterium]